MITDNVSVVEYYANDTAMETLIPWFGKHWKTPVVGFDCQGVPPNPLAFNKCPLKGVPP